MFTPVSNAVKFAFTSSASAVVPFRSYVSPVTFAEVNARFTPARTASKFSFIASASATESLVKVFGTETVCAFTAAERASIKKGIKSSMCRMERVLFKESFRLETSQILLSL